MRYILFFVFASICLPLHATFAKNDEEALLVRRINEFWHDREYPFAKVQIEEFLAKFPKSDSANTFYAMLGNISMEEKDYERGLNNFDKINSCSLARQVRLKRFHCLYQLKKYSTLQELLPNILKENPPKAESDLCHFYYAEALFRKAATIYNEGEKEFILAKEYCLEAITHYEELVYGPFASHAKIALAEIYRLLGEYERAAIMYLDLSSLPGSDFNESLLLHAGKMLSKFDKDRAIATFSHLARFGVKQQEEAALLWARLLFQDKRWEELALNQEEIFNYLSSKTRDELHYFLGEARFHLGEFAPAAHHLEIFLQKAGLCSQEENALLTLMKAYRELKMVEKLEVCWARYLSHYGNDPAHLPEKTRAQLMRALALKEWALAEGKKMDRAIAEFDAIFSEWVEAPREETKEIAEIALAEKTLLYFRFKKWRASYAAAGDYLSYFPNGHNQKMVCKFSLSSLLEQIYLVQTQGKLQEERHLLETLASDLERINSNSSSFTEKEKEESRQLLAKAYYTIGKSSEAISILHTQLMSNPSSQKSAELHFLLALCYLKENRSPKKAIFYGENALALNESGAPFPEERMLHLGLFNAYLALKNQIKREEERKAADHLFLAISAFPLEESTRPISLENLLWLSRFYYREVMEGSKKAGEETIVKTVFTLEHLLGRDKDPVNFTPNLPFLEEEALKLAKIYAINEELQKEKALLLALLAFENNHRATWKYYFYIKLALADCYLKNGEIGMALPLYSQLEMETPDDKIEILYKARLMSARLTFAMLPEEEKNEESPALLEILNKLKELVLRKNLSLEPIHLEAAIDYADFSSRGCSKREEIHLALLRVAKEEFTKQDDIHSKDYQASFAIYPEKAAVYQAYLRYIDAKILLLEGEIALSHGENSLGKGKISAARALFSTLRQKRFALSLYLNDKVGRV